MLEDQKDKGQFSAGNFQLTVFSWQFSRTKYFISPSRTGFFFFGVKKKQKTPAENFSFEASGLAWAVRTEKFVRPDLSRTGDTVLRPSWAEIQNRHKPFIFK
ncbi:hypothetical protein ASU31_24490 [Pedobacter ginsenosidimutans]|uniref:Uncharacterized protein n=1 Tax=Pedobacter ginsenosidimutans TaxID=687842 RepID=A0A0T5VJS3_9SPHI|nr:hypothetical protein ASU31_24490 [Pedobacter ginsenosidimutans]